MSSVSSQVVARESARHIEKDQIYAMCCYRSKPTLHYLRNNNNTTISTDFVFKAQESFEDLIERSVYISTGNTNFYV